MAKKSLTTRNEKRKSMNSRLQSKRSALSKIAKNVEASFEDRLSAQIKLAELPRNSSIVRYRNRCNLTGRPRGYFRQFGLSRISLRDLASWGRIPGLIKSSW